jgi:hypothetical protein
LWFRKIWRRLRIYHSPPPHHSRSRSSARKIDLISRAKWKNRRPNFFLLPHIFLSHTLILSNGQGYRNFTLFYLQNEYVDLYVKYVLQTIETTNLLLIYSTATV